MSTRAQIKLKDSEDNIHIYKHSDGYPQGVMPVLAPFVERFMKNRGYDASHLLCQIVRVFAVRGHINSCMETDDMYKPKPGDYFSFDGDYIGWGLDCCKHGDIDYLYEIDDEGSIYINGDKQTKEQLKGFGDGN